MKKALKVEGETPEQEGYTFNEEGNVSFSTEAEPMQEINISQGPDFDVGKVSFEEENAET